MSDQKDLQKVYERCMDKFEKFNLKLAKEEGYFIGVVNRPMFDVYPVSEELKKALESDKEEKEEKKSEGKGLSSLK